MTRRRRSERVGSEINRLALSVEETDAPIESGEGMHLNSGTRPSAAMIVAVAALSLALVGTAVAGPDAITSAVTKKSVKKVAKKQANKQITKRAPGLSVLEAETARPTGPAGGDLTGQYPNPLIGEQKVTTEKIADAAVQEAKIAAAAVTNAKIAGDAVTTDKIAPGQVGGSDLGQVIIRSAQDVDVPTGDNGVAAVSCQGAETRLSGGAFWNAATTGNKGLQATFAFGQSGWIGIGRNQSGTPQTFNVQVLCLQG